MIVKQLSAVTAEQQIAVRHTGGRVHARQLKDDSIGYSFVMISINTTSVPAVLLVRVDILFELL